MNRLIIAALAFAASACQAPANDTDADIAAIHSNVQGLTAAYEARDWDAFTGYFADDAIWMPPDLPQLQGKDAWWEFASGFWDASEVLDIATTTEEVIVSGDWAIERHTEFQTISTGEGSEPFTMYFKGIWVFRRGDQGDWKIARYIWNGNIPVTE